MQHECKIGRFRPWIVLGAATAINMTMGVTYSWSLIKKALVTDWQWSNVEASFPLTIYTVVFALAVVFAGRMQDKLGPRLIATLGAVMLGTGLISCSFAHTPISMVLTYGIAGIGNGLCYASTIPASIKWFPPERKGLVTGIVVSGIGLASVYISPIANWLLGNWGISRTFLVLGTGAFVVMIFSANLLSNPPANYRPLSRIGGIAVPGNITGQVSCDINWPEMIRTKLFYKLWFMYLFVASAGLMIIGHIATIAKTQANWENGFYLVIMFAIFNTGGRFMAGFFSDKYGRRNVMLLVFAMQAVNLLFFASYITPELLVLGTMMTGLCYGSFFALFPLATADFFGMRNFGVNYGLIFLAWGFAGILGPILAGSAVDMTGNYYIAYAISAGLSLFVFFLALTIHPLAKHQ
ncbi:MAG: OFA family MFS transporter [Syntrophales bacterium]|jgi:OFA family oxalate/formate antiporter-like MFS transporter